MNIEVWRAVPGYEGRYEVSDLGRVRSLDRTVELIRLGKTTTRRRKGVVLSPGLTPEGYLLVVLHRDDGGSTRRVHRLVLEAFVGPAPSGTQALHGDGDEGNCRLSNLRWGTPKENSADAIRHGTQTRMPGEKHHQAKLTDGLVRLIRRALEYRVPGTVIARGVGVSPSTVSLIRRGKNWTHVKERWEQCGSSS